MLKENKIRRLFVNHADSSWAELLNAVKEMQVADDSLGNTRRVSAFPLLDKPIRSCLVHAQELPGAALETRYSEAGPDGANF